MAQITVTIPDDVYDELKAEADERELSVTAVGEERICLERAAATRRGLAALAEMQESAAPWNENMTEDEIMELAVSETRKVRAARAAERTTGAGRR
ncbi:MAG: hypothetical protein C0506_14485 [Anaerolinea sp.]|nr:hypothetical protein [Anaerolinea sp.]